MSMRPCPKNRNWKDIQGKGKRRRAKRAHYFSRALLRVDFAIYFAPGHILGTVKTLAALAAAIRAIGKKKQNPKFQNAPALGSMHMFAAAQGAISIFGVHEQAKFAFHWPRMIAPGDCVCKRPGRRCCRIGNGMFQIDANTCMA